MKISSKNIKKKCHGFSIIEVLFALGIILMSTDLIWDYVNMGLIAKQQRIAADHLEAVNVATADYIKAHQTDLLSTTTKTSGVELTISNLIDEELLPEGFNVKNVWLHDYAIYIRQPKTDELQGIVLTTSSYSYDENFMNVTIPGTAALLGGSGGYIPSGTLPSQNTGQLMGSYRAWQLELADYGISSPGAGHLGALATFGSSELGLDFLYRIEIPGEPELNAMQTELDMTDHAIENIKNLQFVSHSIDEFICEETANQGQVFFDEEEGLYMCRENRAVVVADTGNTEMLKEIQFVGNLAMIEKPQCPAGTNTEPYIYVAPSIVSTSGDATALASVQAWAESFDENTWQVKMRALSKDQDWIYPNADYAKMIVFTSCAEITQNL